MDQKLKERCLGATLLLSVLAALLMFLFKQNNTEEVLIKTHEGAGTQSYKQYNKPDNDHGDRGYKDNHKAHHKDNDKDSHSAPPSRSAGTMNSNTYYSGLSAGAGAGAYFDAHTGTNSATDAQLMVMPNQAGAKTLSAPGAAQSKQVDIKQQTADPKAVRMTSAAAAMHIPPSSMTSSAWPTYRSTPVQISSASSVWVMRLGVFTEPKNAKLLIEKLVHQGYDAFSKIENHKGSIVTRVFVGPKHSEADIKKIQARVKKDFNMQGIILVINNPERGING